jgi:diguanylate cyclase (GGDEF)-like protein/PAS domain S-box-containing protein
MVVALGTDRQLAPRVQVIVFNGAFAAFLVDAALIWLTAGSIDHLRSRASTTDARNHKLRIIVDHLPVLVSYIDRDLRYRYNNAYYKQITGLEPEQIYGKSVQEVFGTNSYQRRQDQFARALAGHPVDFEQQAKLNGAVRMLHVHYVPDIDANRQVRGFFVLGRDITEQKKAEKAFAHSEERLRTIADQMPALICYIDRDRRFQFNNHTYSVWLKRPLSEITGRHVHEVLRKETYEMVRDYMEQAFAGQKAPFQRDLIHNGEPRYFRGIYIPHKDSNGKVIGIYGMTNDITPLKLVENQLILMAKHDSLTGLANRAQFNEKLSDAIARSCRSRMVMAVLFLDIDHFESINDELSHQSGDQVLIEFAQRLKDCVRQTDTVARLAGDEFVVLLEGMHTAEEATIVADKIIHKMESPFEIAGAMRRITASIGIAIRPESQTDAEALLHKADEALYMAKAAGRNTYQLVH